jgi:hypothetical protein
MAFPLLASALRFAINASWVLNARFPSLGFLRTYVPSGSIRRAFTVSAQVAHRHIIVNAFDQLVFREREQHFHL